ncbi:Crossover junction endonuclease EME1 [Geodia barretti]|uniref:Crossover junction endonuclease EME1 n=1 Tax=Geodia barretti TaxID=519541 RepID=A0AA35S849_GEOBA|nr:Crossover junction endonuclease EME1 [Geodia barretti]
MAARSEPDTDTVHHNPSITKKPRENEQITKAEQRQMIMKRKEQQQKVKQFEKAMKEALRETRREASPQERLRQMVLVLDSSLAENSELMESLVGELEEMGVEHRVGVGGVPGGVTWRRKQRERNVTENAEIEEVVFEKEENHLLLTLEAHGFAGLVKMSKQDSPLPVGANTLLGYVEEARRGRGDWTVSLAVEGLDKYFRYGIYNYFSWNPKSIDKGNKTKANRQFRQQVLGTGSSQDPSSEVTWTDCQEAIISLQLATGSSVRLCAGEEELAEHVLTLTKAVCNKPFSKENHFSFHPDAAGGKKKRVESGDQVAAPGRTS